MKDWRADKNNTRSLLFLQNTAKCCRLENDYRNLARAAVYRSCGQESLPFSGIGSHLRREHLRGDAISVVATITAVIPPPECERAGGGGGGRVGSYKSQLINRVTVDVFLPPLVPPCGRVFLRFFVV